MRYPGSKDKIAKKIMDAFPDPIGHHLTECGFLWNSPHPCEYRDPFVGAGAIACRVMRKLLPTSRIWLNDCDYALICLWNAIRDDIKELCKLIASYSPRVEDYYRFKEEDSRTDIDPVLTGFQKLALHQMSFSGLGAMSGGPLGGHDQTKAAYPIDCRWSATNLIVRMRRIHRLLARFGNRIEITCRDFAECFRRNGTGVFLYCDPPYYAKGPSLYKYSMTDADHERLAQECRSTKHRWVVSYDAAPEVLALYAGFPHVPIDHVYTVAEARGIRRKNREILILDGGRPDAR
jgi:DNA adenine methylase